MTSSGGYDLSVLRLDQWDGYGVRVTNPDIRNEAIVADALANSDERIVLDLRASQHYQANAGNWRRIDSEYYLKPGTCIRLRVQDHIQLSKSVCALVVSRASLAADGLSVAFVKIDPQFQGQPEISVANTSRRRIRIVPDMKFASIMILALDTAMVEDKVRQVTQTQGVQLPPLRERARGALPFVATGVLTFLAAGAPEVIKNIFGG